MDETDQRQKIARPWAACYERGKLKVMCFSIANIQLLKPVICGIFNMKKKQNKTKLQIGRGFPVFKASVISLVLFTEQSLRKSFLLTSQNLVYN